MAKSIDLTRPKPDPALLARATGADRPRVPPPARPVEGMADLPLPQGQLMTGPRTTRDPRSLTPRERETLGQLGWQEGTPIPENAAEIVAQVAAEAQAERENLPPPIDPRTPPLAIPETRPLAELSAEEQARFRRLLTEGAARQQAQREDDAARERLSLMGEGAVAAYDLARGLAQGEPAAAPEPEPAAAEPAATAPAPPPAETGAAGAAPLVCEHCGWAHGMPDVPEPPDEVKLAFLHALLGGQCFTQETTLYGGNLTVAFRALTLPEVEVIYKQAYRDRQTGKISEAEADFWEIVNRYRLLLQLQQVHSTGLHPLHADLPDGLSRETNPGATAYWNCEEPPPLETVLPQIEDYIVQNVLKTESLFRVVHSACNQFNRLVAKLEATMDNGPFWKATGPPS